MTLIHALAKEIFFENVYLLGERVYDLFFPVSEYHDDFYKLAYMDLSIHKHISGMLSTDSIPFLYKLIYTECIIK